MGDNKSLYCRICFNSSRWQRPSGDASRLETDSYASEHGFGHEEWLLDFSRLFSPDDVTEYKYSYLQPIGKFKRRYTGTSRDVLLYTVCPTKHRLAVGIVRNLYVPEDDELNLVRDRAVEAGLIDEMVKSVRPYNLKGKDPDWHECDASLVFNVRFRTGDVELFEPLKPLAPDHPLTSYHRYHPRFWDAGDPLPQDFYAGVSSSASEKMKSEALRTKCAIAGITYVPSHDRLQNALCNYLVSSHPKAKVMLERNCVDITVVDGKRVVLFEIKVAPTAKSCIRQALGQLLEYCHYPAKSVAQELIVIGENSPAADDASYMSFIRNTYALPIFYRRWNGTKLEKPI